jgi:nodulation protein E
MARRVVVTGMGAISALGQGTKALWAGLSEGRSAIAPLEGFAETDLRLRIGAQVRGFDPATQFEARDLALLDRFAQFAVVAAREALGDAALDPREVAGGVAAILGTGVGGFVTADEAWQRLYRQNNARVHPFAIPKIMASAATSQVSMHLGVRGPCFTVSSACASANHALATAMYLLRGGAVDVALAGGSEAPFTYGLLKAWDAMRVLSSDNCRPFSKNRSGMVLGEGAGVLVLETLEHAQQRGARIRVELAGVGMSADAHHITDPAPDGAARALSAALADAALAPEDVDYVNAHGTGTVMNDRSETRAMRMAFGAHADRLAVSSTKSMHGHALGAAGGLEAIATIQAIEHGLVPPTANFVEAGEGCDLDVVPNRPREMRVRAALSSSFAFGGLNAVAAFKAWRS